MTETTTLPAPEILSPDLLEQNAVPLPDVAESTTSPETEVRSPIDVIAVPTEARSEGTLDSSLPDNGSLIRKVKQRRRGGFAVMAIALPALALLASFTSKGSIERDLKLRSKQILEQLKLPNVVVKADGRRLALVGVVATQEQKDSAARLVGKRHGVESVNVDRLIVSGATEPGGSSDTIPTSAVPAPVESTLSSGQQLPATVEQVLRPTTVTAHLNGSSLHVVATVSDKVTSDLLLKRVSQTLTSDQLVNDVKIDPNDGLSDPTAYRRIGEFLEFMVKSRLDTATLKFENGPVEFDAVVKDASDAAALRGEVLRLVGDETKLRANIAISGDAPATDPNVTVTTTQITVSSAEIADDQAKLTADVATQTVSFQPNAAILDTKGLATVVSISTAIRSFPNPVTISVNGYTDSSGPAASNLLLSQKRAEAVKAEMVKNGISPNLIVAKGFGSANPIADNNSIAGKSKNRRIEFVVSK